MNITTLHNQFIVLKWGNAGYRSRLAPPAPTVTPLNPPNFSIHPRGRQFFITLSLPSDHTTSRAKAQCGRRTRRPTNRWSTPPRRSLSDPSAPNADRRNATRKQQLPSSTRPSGTFLQRSSSTSCAYYNQATYSGSLEYTAAYEISSSTINLELRISSSHNATRS